jgi:hypothetical protein
MFLKIIRINFNFSKNQAAGIQVHHHATLAVATRPGIFPPVPSTEEPMQGGSSPPILNSDPVE